MAMAEISKKIFKPKWDVLEEKPEFTHEKTFKT